MQNYTKNIPVNIIFKQIFNMLYEEKNEKYFNCPFFYDSNNINFVKNIFCNIENGLKGLLEYLINNMFISNSLFHVIDISYCGETFFYYTKKNYLLNSFLHNYAYIEDFFSNFDYLIGNKYNKEKKDVRNAFLYYSIETNFNKDCLRDILNYFCFLYSVDSSFLEIFLNRLDISKIDFLIVISKKNYNSKNIDNNFYNYHIFIYPFIFFNSELGINYIFNSSSIQFDNYNFYYGTIKNINIDYLLLLKNNKNEEEKLKNLLKSVFINYEYLSFIMFVCFSLFIKKKYFLISEFYKMFFSKEVTINDYKNAINNFFMERINFINLEKKTKSYFSKKLFDIFKPEIFFNNNTIDNIIYLDSFLNYYRLCENISLFDRKIFINIDNINNLKNIKNFLRLVPLSNSCLNFYLREGYCIFFSEQLLEKINIMENISLSIIKKNRIMIFYD